MWKPLLLASIVVGCTAPLGGYEAIFQEDQWTLYLEEGCPNCSPAAHHPTGPAEAATFNISAGTRVSAGTKVVLDEDSHVNISMEGPSPGRAKAIYMYGDAHHQTRSHEPSLSMKVILPPGSYRIEGYVPPHHENATLRMALSTAPASLR